MAVHLLGPIICVAAAQIMTMSLCTLTQRLIHRWMHAPPGSEELCVRVVVLRARVGVLVADADQAGQNTWCTEVAAHGCAPMPNADVPDADGAFRGHNQSAGLSWREALQGRHAML